MRVLIDEMIIRSTLYRQGDNGQLEQINAVEVVGCGVTPKGVMNAAFKHTLDMHLDDIGELEAQGAAWGITMWKVEE